MDHRNWIVGDDTPPTNIVPIVGQATNPPPETNPPPHAVGVEKSVLSVVFQYPEKLAALTPELFYFPHHQQLVAAMRAAPSLDLVSFVQHLLDIGLLDRMGGPSTIADIYTHEATNLNFDHHLAILAEKSAARAAITHARDLIREIEESPGEAVEIIEKATKRLVDAAGMAASGSGMLAKAYALAYRPDSPQPADEVIMSLGDAPIAAQSGLTVVQGKAKAGKSAVVSSIIGAALRGRYAAHGDTIDIVWSGKDSEGAVIHFDTEQSPGDWWGLATRGVLRSGVNKPEIVRRLVSIPLVQFRVKERRSLLEAVLRDQNSKMGSVSVVIIDGVADICKDPNDPEESFETVRWLMEISHKYATAIICILHENPDSDSGKTRGHLGSELTRKAYGNLRVEKDEDSVSVLFGPLMRKKDIPKHMGTCFAWSDDHRMHVTIGSQKDVVAAKRADKAADAQDRRDQEDLPKLEEILDDPLSFSDITSAVMTTFDVKKRAAEIKISKWNGRLIIKNNDGKYVLK